MLAFSEIEIFNSNECIDWAIEMLRLGYETPSILILAATNKPTNISEVSQYLRSALKELGFEEKSGAAAILSYNSYYLGRLASGANIKDNLASLYQVYLDLDMPVEINDFYLLYWAWQDLDYWGDRQSYWPGATSENIEAIVIETAKSWIVKNEPIYRI